MEPEDVFVMAKYMGPFQVLPLNNIRPESRAPHYIASPAKAFNHGPYPTKIIYRPHHPPYRDQVELGMHDVEGC